MTDAQASTLRQRFTPSPIILQAPGQRLMRVAASFTIVFAALTITLAAVPQARALVNSVLDMFFPRATVSERTIESVEYDEDDIMRFETLEEGMALAPFDVRVPQNLPEDYDLSMTQYLNSREALQIFYSPSGASTRNISQIYLQQQAVEMAEQTGLFFYTFAPFDIGPEAQIETVQVGSVMGEYVQGSWATTQPDDPDATYRWDDSFPFHRLRWQDGEMLYELAWIASRTEFDMDRLIAIAESITP